MLTDLFLRGRLRNEMSQRERDALEGAISRTVEVGPRQTLVERGQRLDKSYYLVEGTMLRHLDDRNGDRQLVGVNIAGDFVDLHGYPMKRLDHNVGTLTPVVLAEIPHAAISRLIEEFPHLGRILWFSTLLDAAMHREWIFRLGRLNAEGRIAHLIAELIERLRFVGLYDGGRLPIPLLQRDFADACGITLVHANRSIRTLRERGILVLEGEGKLRVIDEAALRALCRFDGSYLYGGGELALDGFSDGSVPLS